MSWVSLLSRFQHYNISNQSLVSMKLSEIKTMETQKKKFFVNKEKLKAVWELVSRVYSSWTDAEPWCDKCEDGRIRIQATTGFWYKTEVCWCVETVKEINDIILELKIAWVDISIVEKYNLENYTTGMFSLEETEQLLNKEGWIYAHGDVWTWKTYLAIICLYFASSCWYTVQYANIPKLLDRLRPSETKDDALIDSLCEVDFLILDDLWQEKNSPWVMERLYIIINERYIHDKKTVITSNWSLDKLSEKLWHKAIVSRIKWSSTPVLFIWNDKR